MVDPIGVDAFHLSGLVGPFGCTLGGLGYTVTLSLELGLMRTPAALFSAAPGGPARGTGYAR